MEILVVSPGGPSGVPSSWRHVDGQAGASASAPVIVIAN